MRLRTTLRCSSKILNSVWCMGTRATVSQIHGGLVARVVSKSVCVGIRCLDCTHFFTPENTENGETELPPQPANEEIVEDEPQPDLQLKLTLMDIYNGRVDKRLLAKRFIFDRGLLQHKKIQAAERKRPREEKDLVNRLKPFARLQSAQEHERFVDGVVYETTLRKRISELQEYRRMGLTSLSDVDLYEKDKVARANFRPMPGREQMLQQSSSNANGVSGSRRDSKKGEDLSRESTPSVRSIKKTPTSLASSQSLYLLSEEEQKLCQSVKILPKPYLVIKEALVRESYKRAGRLTKEDATQLINNVEDVKIEEIYTFLSNLGLLHANTANIPA